METRAHYVLIGAFTLGAVLLAALFALWMTGSRFDRETSVFDVVFVGPVRGLARGGEVRFNGIKVGEVTDLRIDAADPNNVVARVRIDGATPVRTSSEASLESLGLTGVTLIQLTAGEPKTPLLRRRLGQPIPRIVAKPGAFDDLVAAGQDVAQRVNEILVSAQTLFTPENIAAVTATLENLDRMSAALAADDGAVTQIAEAAQALDRAATSVETLSEETRVRFATIEGGINGTLDETERAAASIAAAAEDTRRFVTTAQSAADVAAYQALPDISAAARDLRRLAISVENLTGSVSGSASLVNGGGSRPKVEVDP